MKVTYMLNKMLQAAITVFFVLVINYFLFRIMPGDPLNILLRDPKISPEALLQVKSQFGLDLPWYNQFFLYIKQLLQGDLGNSFMFRQPVIDIIASKLIPTILLVGTASLIALVGGTLLGIWAARRRGTKVDALSLGFSLFTYSMPTFWVGVVLIAFFSVYLALFPTTGMMTAGQSFANTLDLIADVGWHLVLPVVTLSLVLIGQYVLIMRNTLLEVLTDDYIQTARAKGFSEKYIVRRHAVPNAMLPLVTLISINLGFVIAGGIEIETVFSWPGIGRLMFEALMNRDYPLLQGIFLVISICVVFANLLADFLYSYLDPRIKT